MGCLFCELVERPPAESTVADESAFVAVLDHRPVFPGHTLVLPRRHCGTLLDLESREVAPFFLGVQRVARAVEAGLQADGTFVAINNRVSQSVPHLHVHVIPRRRKDGLRGFFWPRVKYGEGEQEAVRKAIAAPLDDAGRGAAGRLVDGPRLRRPVSRSSTSLSRPATTGREGLP